jgi:hypothetical protein
MRLEKEGKVQDSSSTEAWMKCGACGLMRYWFAGVGGGQSCPVWSHGLGVMGVGSPLRARPGSFYVTKTESLGLTWDTGVKGVPQLGHRSCHFWAVR